MITFAAKSESQLKRLVGQWLPKMEFPLTATFKGGVSRSIQQNNLQHLWISEAAKQLADQSEEDYRAFCKLHGGVPILRAEDAGFRHQYDEIIRPLDYQLKLKLMRVPIDFPVTRLMKVKQFKQYLDWMYAHFSGLGVKLTDPMDGYYGW